MSNENISNKDYEPMRKVFLAWLDEKNIYRDGYVTLVHFDASFIKFKTGGNVIIIPTIKMLKIKYPDEEL